MPSAFSILAILLVVALAGIYQVVVAPLLNLTGTFRENAPFNNENCTVAPELNGCEKMLLDETSGLLYLACTPATQALLWMPGMGNLNAKGKTEEGYIATYDPDTGKITRLQITDSALVLPRGFATHGMDVVHSVADPSEIFIYAVNHRVPLHGDPARVGADSVVEIFKGRVGGSTLTHVVTVEDPLIWTPNDVVGSPDGKSFWVTNDHEWKASAIYRMYEIVMRTAGTSVVYCHVGEGCKIAAGKLQGANGIAKSRTNDTFYVGSVALGEVTVLEKQTDNTLVLTDHIPTILPVDNITVDKNGALWLASFPKGYATLRRHHDLSVLCPVVAFSVSQNTDNSAYFGKKYNVQRVFEDDGAVISFATTMVRDVDRGLLFLSGVAATELAICKI